MVFEHPFFAEYVAYGPRILVDDGRIGNDVDDAIKLVLLRVMQRIAQAGQRFAAAGGYGEGINASRVFRSVQTGIGNVAADFINGITRLKT